MHIANKTAKLLIRNGKTIAIAESCTGGALSNALTNIPGSSKFFLLGLIPYHNKFKTLLLKISPKILRTKGAVSPETAFLMAKNIRRLSKASFGLGLTGIAGPPERHSVGHGPTGGTKTKPVGLVYIGISSSRKTICKKFIFRGSRISIKKQAANAALKLLIENL